MNIAAARKTQALSQAQDPRKALLEAVGDLSDVEVYYNQILVGTYVRPNVTKGGIIRPEENVKEDEYQGKVGLVLKVGPSAFVSDDEDFMGQNVEVGDWIVYRVGDGFPLILRDTACRMLTDRNIRLRIKDPGDIY